MSDRSRTRPRRGIRGGGSVRRKRLAWINCNLEQGVQWDNIPVAHSGGQQRPLYSPATWEPESSDDGYTWDMQIPSKMSSLQQTSTSQSPLKKNLFPEISAVQSLSKMISQPAQQKLNP